MTLKIMERGDMQEVDITPEMIEAGVAAYEEWDRFAERPLDGKNRTWLTRKEEERLCEEAMVVEIVRAVFGSTSVTLSGV